MASPSWSRSRRRSTYGAANTDDDLDSRDASMASMANRCSPPSGMIVQCMPVVRTFALALLLYVLAYLPYSILVANVKSHTTGDGTGLMSSIRPSTDVFRRECVPGIYGNASSQMRHTADFRFRSKSSGETVLLPLYSNVELIPDKDDNDEKDVLTVQSTAFAQITHAIIIQHGNLRTANVYYCAAVNALRSANVSEEALKGVLIIAPQFLVENDVCWNRATGEAFKVNEQLGHTCGYAIFSNEGWKDGHLSLPVAASTAPSSPLSQTVPRLYSYDIFNEFIEYFSDLSIFPRVNKITLFGFSAGSQVVLRYAMLPMFKLPRSSTDPPVDIQFVVSNPSSFLYMNNKRPFTNGTAGFGVPDPSYLPASWLHDGQGNNWTLSWSGHCEQYNQWRFGFDKLAGYYEHLLGANPALKDKTIDDFQTRPVTYLLGTADTLNCKLSSFQGCDDNELATYCQAMLQGGNRVDRTLKYMQYLQHFYGKPTHTLVKVENVGHDPISMLMSPQARCLVFDLCR
jgi:hypothetical protein